MSSNHDVPNVTVTDMYNERMPDLNLTYDVNDLSTKNMSSYYTLPQDLKCKKTESSNFSVLHYNIRSLCKKFDLFNCFSIH